MNCDLLLKRTRKLDDGTFLYTWCCGNCRHIARTNHPSPPVRKCKPSLADVGSFAVAVLKTISEGKLARKETVEHRLAACQQCQHFQPENNRCTHCGCKVSHNSGKFLTDLTNKLAHPSQACPIGKWGPES